MANSALEIPQNSQKVIALVATGFKPIWYHNFKSTMKFYSKIMNNEECEVTLNLKKELMKLKTASTFMSRVNYIVKQLKCSCEEYTEQKSRRIHA